MFTWQQIFSYNPKEPMIFTHYMFWVVYLALMIGYSFVYRAHKTRIIYLLAFSLFIYYKQGGYFFFLLIYSTLVDYGMGNLIYYSKKRWFSKLCLILSICMTLIILGFFKYHFMIIDIVNSVFHTGFHPFNYLAYMANSLSGEHFSLDKIILPAGISFFTFQTISYSVDLYRKKIEPAKNIIDFGFFVTFFPQLVAGPIVRASVFIPQMYQAYQVTIREFGYAVFLVLNGLTKKILISDYIAVNFVDRVFDDPHKYSGFENLMAVYGYTIRIYCDFSGYTDIAIGLALLLGFRLPLNFHSPYKAVNITDFWRRWHISLSTWLKDYLYISLGGNRKGKFRTYLNLIITMLLGGLWHGASLKFVVWGGLHGAALAIHKGWSSFVKPSNNRILSFISIFITFHFVAFCWIFFNARDMDIVNAMLHQIFYNFNASLIPSIVSGYRNIFLLILFAYLIHFLPVKWKEIYKSGFIELPMIFKAITICFFIILLYQVASSQIQPFIYFQF